MTIARVTDSNRFLEVFANFGAEKRREHGCRAPGPKFLADPDIPAIARELGIQAPPLHALRRPNSTPDHCGMDVMPSQARRFSSMIGHDAVRFGDRILIAPALGKEAGASMSAYTPFFHAGRAPTCQPLRGDLGWCSAERSEWAPRTTP